MQSSFFDVSPIKKSTIHVYHDESGSDSAHSRYLLQGALFIRHSNIEKVIKLLSSCRGDYSGRIHFVQLRDRTSSKRGEISWKWLDLFYKYLVYENPYRCLIYDRKSPFNKPNTTEEYIYNYSAMMCIRGGICWSFTEFDQLELQIYSEKMDRRDSKSFASYVTKELCDRSKTRRAGSPKSPIIDERQIKMEEIDGDPKTVTSDHVNHCELIQLVDLITGSIAQSINQSSIQDIKIDMGLLAKDVISDTRLPPWMQELDLHRKFSISSYPDKEGRFFDVPITIVSKSQMGF